MRAKWVNMGFTTTTTHLTNGRKMVMVNQRCETGNISYMLYAILYKMEPTALGVLWVL